MPSHQEFWSDASHTYGARNPTRAAQIAEVVQSLTPSSILDLGCGDQSIRQYFSEEYTRYVPVDIVKRSEDCAVVDLNKTDWDFGNFDVTITIGLLQYLDCPYDCIRHISAKTNHWIVNLPFHQHLLSVYGSRSQNVPYPVVSPLTYGTLVSDALQFFSLDGERILSNGDILLHFKSHRSKSALLDFHQSLFQCPSLLNSQSNATCHFSTKKEWSGLHYASHYGYLSALADHLCPESIIIFGGFDQPQFKTSVQPFHIENPSQAWSANILPRSITSLVILSEPHLYWHHYLAQWNLISEFQWLLILLDPVQQIHSNNPPEYLRHSCLVNRDHYIVKQQILTNHCIISDSISSLYHHVVVGSLR